MKKILFILTTIFLIFCSTQAPKEDEVKQIVKDWYLQQDAARGYGQSDISGITVLSVERDAKDKDHFNTRSLVTGKYIPGPAESNMGHPINDTVHMKLEWNGAKWVTID